MASIRLFRPWAPEAACVMCCASHRASHALILVPVCSNVPLERRVTYPLPIETISFSSLCPHRRKRSGILSLSPYCRIYPGTPGTCTQSFLQCVRGRTGSQMKERHTPEQCTGLALVCRPDRLWMETLIPRGHGRVATWFLVCRLREG